MQFHAIDESRLKLVHKVEHGRELDFIVQTNCSIVLRQLVAQQALDEIQIPMDQCRSGFLLGFGTNVGPEISEEPNILNEFVFAAAFRCGTDDESPGQTILVLVNDAFETRTLFIGTDFARHADVIDSRHVHQVSAGHGDVRGDTRALLAERLFGNLNQDLLTLPQ